MEVMGDQQNPIANHDAAERDEADETGNRQGLPREHQGDDAANERGRQGIENLQHDADRRIENHQHYEHSDDRYQRQDEDQRGRALLAFELPAVFDEVPFRQTDASRHALLNVGDDARKIAALRVAADDHAAPRVLAVGGIRSDAFADFGEIAQLHLAALVGQIDAEPAEIGVV